MTVSTYDIIGDVHGQKESLEALLLELGYQKDDLGWYQQNHQAVFVGDLIDKGPDPAGVLQLVRSMADRGAARLVVGNHELNWIVHAADHCDSVETFWSATNRHQDRRRISTAFSHHPEQLIDLFHWLQRQPLFIEVPDVMRVVHACWDDEAVAQLRSSAITCLDEAALEGYRDTYSATHLALDLVVAGCHHKFPDGRMGGHGVRSDRFRVQWWSGELAPVHPYEIKPVAGFNSLYQNNAPAVFFGHYALRHKPAPLLPNVACVDFGAAWNEPLVAYRHRANQALDSRHFVTHPLERGKERDLR